MADTVVKKSATKHSPTYTITSKGYNIAVKAFNFIMLKYSILSC